MTKRNKTLKKIYCILGIAIMLYCGYIVEILVMHIWHKAPQGEHSAAGMSEADKQFQEMLAGVDKEHSAGVSFKDINKIHELYDFHKSDREALLDEQNLCVSCHGDVPHDKKKEIRAFLNMHAFFMGCETCHIRTEDKINTKFIWYNKTDGAEAKDIDLTQYLGDTPYKLMPVKRSGEDKSLYDTAQMRKYVAGFKENVADMIPSAKSASMKVIHRPMTELKETVKCEECHTSNRAAGYLPFKDIGYPERRMNQLVGNEVVGMIDKYKRFYIPDFLTPNEEAESEK
ncbi:MAG: cytochrome C [Denitrovibrio sp.]|nr:MAG: cytochrome C [Denitrovibrio sp.]